LRAFRIDEFRPRESGREAAAWQKEPRREAGVLPFCGVLHGQHLALDGLPEARALKGETHCDVAVVGSGIAGLSTAYELSKRGRSVIVIDRKGSPAV
jgi:NADPH-dependent 2,4-dienoyl-CoA reductase/sulfur reductase-like enzyme